MVRNAITHLNLLYYVACIALYHNKWCVYAWQFLHQYRADVDECAENIDGCAQTCFNTEGSYACSCNAGYRLAGDRHGCDGRPGYTTSLHNNNYAKLEKWWSKINFITPDVNECIEGEHNCHQQAHTVCTNTIGSYTCDCQSGFTLDGLHCTGKITIDTHS